MISIYKIIDNKSDDVYIGSTGQVLKYRIKAHSHKNNTCISKKITDRGDWYYVLIEECHPSERKEREQYHIDKNKCINIKNTIWDEKQYHKKWLQRRREYVKSWGGDIRADNNNLLRICPNLLLS